jgi:hypothetical protein
MEISSCRGIRADQWCIFASMLVGMKQKMGAALPWDGLDPLNMKCLCLRQDILPIIANCVLVKYDAELGGYEQTLYLKGKAVSTLRASRSSS